jgi:flagellar FliJ protein
MSRFHFRLQTLLSYRQHIVEQAEHALAQMLAEERALAEQIESCQRELDRCSQTPTTRTASDLQTRDAYRRQLLDRIAVLQRQLAIVRTECERSRQKLVEHMQERDVVEKLRQRHFDEYLLAERRNEQRQLDDIAARSSHKRTSTL